MPILVLRYGDNQPFRSLKNGRQSQDVCQTLENEAFLSTRLAVIEQRQREREREREPEESRLQINPIIPDKTKPNSEISFEVSSRFFPTEQFHGPCSPIMPVFLRQRARFLLNSCRWTPLRPFPSTSVSLSASWLFTLRQYRAVVIPLSV